MKNIQFSAIIEPQRKQCAPEKSPGIFCPICKVDNVFPSYRVKDPLEQRQGGIDLEDTHIVDLYWKRDADAIKESSEKYGGFCFSIANNILHNKEDSEECVNDTWLKAWNSIPPTRPKSLRMFLARITRNLSFDCFTAKSAKKRGSGEIDLVLDELSECIPSDSDVASEYEFKELCLYIQRFVNNLSDKDKTIFLRRYFFTDSVADISAMLGLSENSIMVNLCRTRKKLKIYLQKEGFIDE